jgi:DNA polymerase-3 subunit beta
MRLTMPRADLARLLAATVKVVEARNTIQIISTVRLVADGGKLTATGTDLDVEVTSTVDCEAEADGAVCVTAGLLDGIVKKLPPATDVSLSLKDGILTVKSGRYTSRLQTLPAEDFPSFSVSGFTKHFDVDLAALFAPVQFAISTEETRYYLNGIYLSDDGERLVAVATDGHRLSRHYSESVGEFSGVIVPRKLVGLVPKGTVSVSLSDTKIRLTTSDSVITSKLIDGTFPDYRRVIPTGNDKIVTFDAGLMAKAVDRVSVVSSERGRAVKLSITEGIVSLAVNNPESGNATDEVVASYSGEPLEIGYNSGYLGEIIGQFPAGDISLALADGGSPSLFTAASAPNLLAVLMPMRV